MSLFGGIIAGAMQGGGNALQVVGRDQARADEIAERDARLAAQQEKIEKQRQEAEMNRQKALEQMRHDNNMAAKRFDYSDEAITGAVSKAQKVKQAEFDIENDPANVDAGLNTFRKKKGAEAEFRTHELSPGQEVYDNNGKRIAGNDRKTTADVYSEAYGSGAKGNGGKIDPNYAARLKDIDTEQRDLQKRVFDLQEKGATDPMVDKGGITSQVAAYQKQIKDLERQKYLEGVRYGAIDPDEVAEQLGSRLENIEQVHSVLKEAARDVSPQWARKLADSFERTGTLQRLNQKDAAATGQIQDSAPDQSGAESARLGRQGIVGSQQRPQELPQGNAPTDLFEQETREIETGARTDYSPAAQRQAETASTQAAAQRQQRDQASVQAEQERMLEQSRGIVGGMQGRQQASQARAAEVKAITPEIATRMSPEEAEQTLAKYGTELPKRVQEILRSLAR